MHLYQPAIETSYRHSLNQDFYLLPAWLQRLSHISCR
jgi:hypothetical protein